MNIGQSEQCYQRFVIYIGMFKESIKKVCLYKDTLFMTNSFENQKIAIFSTSSILST